MSHARLAVLALTGCGTLLVAVTAVFIAGDLDLLTSNEWACDRNFTLAICFLAAVVVVLQRGENELPLACALLVVALGTGLIALVVVLAAAGRAPAGTRAVLRNLGVYALHGGLAVLPLWLPPGHRPGPIWRSVVALMAVVYLVYLAPVAWYGLWNTDPAWTTKQVNDHLPWWYDAGHVVIWMPRLVSVAIVIHLIALRRHHGGTNRRQLTVVTVCYGLYWVVQIYDALHALITKSRPLGSVYLVMLGVTVAALAVGVAVATTVSEAQAKMDRYLRPVLVGIGLVLGLFFCYRGLFTLFVDVFKWTSATTAAALAKPPYCPI